ncbi:DUF4870 domain-containing protein [Streptobacillus canis]|uniref:DUF4870 domain-containing protein n=1 Tax=Streptobacillus canis TaxID=2678686 RepID=UPI0012E157CF|nr:DUF4870 domain-containing protein [Streptobacillus canis]
MKKSVGNLDENLVATIILAAASLPFMGVIFSFGALILEKENNFVRDYAKQGLIFSIIKYACSFFKEVDSFFFAGIYGVLQLILLILIVVTAIHAYKKEEFKFEFMKKIFDYIKL